MSNCHLHLLIFNLPLSPGLLVHFLLLVQAIFAWSAVYKQKKSSDDRQDLEEIVLGEILVGVMFVKL